MQRAWPSRLRSGFWNHYRRRAAAATLRQFCLIFALQAVAFYTAGLCGITDSTDTRLSSNPLPDNTLVRGSRRGGLFDFRIDFAAYSLYGIWAAPSLESKLFLDFRWAIGAGLVGGFLVTPPLSNDRLFIGRLRWFCHGLRNHHRIACSW